MRSGRLKFCKQANFSNVPRERWTIKIITSAHFFMNKIWEIPEFGDSILCVYKWEFTRGAVNSDYNTKTLKIGWKFLKMELKPSIISSWRLRFLEMPVGKDLRTWYFPYFLNFLESNQHPKNLCSHYYAKKNLFEANDACFISWLSLQIEFRIGLSYKTSIRFKTFDFWEYFVDILKLSKTIESDLLTSLFYDTKRAKEVWNFSQLTREWPIPYIFGWTKFWGKLPYPFSRRMLLNPQWFRNQVNFLMIIISSLIALGGLVFLNSRFLEWWHIEILCQVTFSGNDT